LLDGKYVSLSRSGPDALQSLVLGIDLMLQFQGFLLATMTLVLLSLSLYVRLPQTLCLSALALGLGFLFATLSFSFLQPDFLETLLLDKCISPSLFCLGRYALLLSKVGCRFDRQRFRLCLLFFDARRQHDGTVGD
jgi:hypothetical protein